MTPLCTLLKSGSDVLVQTFTVLVYRPSFLGYLRQLKGTGIMWKSDILFLKDVSTFSENSKAKEKKELAGSLAEKKLTTKGCTGRNGEREKSSGKKKISDDRRH
ncbi:hypothetical protein ANN_00804 [Periplaneta americana]|uniref:Uncharacterized protein n=1 Tax=Periplaneta americana TaxID=6978 RepID=A0ABQ8TUR7_PERAM|nr:hypothetical protein ANN_00804 [Periplaneta americana]